MSGPPGGNIVVGFGPEGRAPPLTLTPVLATPPPKPVGRNVKPPSGFALVVDAGLVTKVEPCWRHWRPPRGPPGAVSGGKVGMDWGGRADDMRAELVVVADVATTDSDDPVRLRMVSLVSWDGDGCAKASCWRGCWE